MATSAPPSESLRWIRSASRAAMGRRAATGEEHADEARDGEAGEPGRRQGNRRLRERFGCASTLLTAAHAVPALPGIDSPTICPHGCLRLAQGSAASSTATPTSWSSWPPTSAVRPPQEQLRPGDTILSSGALGVAQEARADACVAHEQ